MIIYYKNLTLAASTDRHVWLEVNYLLRLQLRESKIFPAVPTRRV
jgi:hypothetical protein